MLTARFAPSPAVYLYIAGARTFIYRWPYAHLGGAMIPRIDDSNLKLNTTASLESILDGLNWPELDSDEHDRQSDWLSADPEFTQASADRDPEAVPEKPGAKTTVLTKVPRTALTGQTAGPSASHVFTAIGRQRAIVRLRAI